MSTEALPPDFTPQQHAHIDEAIQLIRQLVSTVDGLPLLIVLCRGSHAKPIAVMDAPLNSTAGKDHIAQVLRQLGEASHADFLIMATEAWQSRGTPAAPPIQPPSKDPNREEIIQISASAPGITWVGTASLSHSPGRVGAFRWATASEGRFSNLLPLKGPIQ